MEDGENKPERWRNGCSRHFALSALNKLSIRCITDMYHCWGLRQLLVL